MKCACGGDSVVKDTRATPTGLPWRRRQCKACKAIFATVEQPTTMLAPAEGRVREPVSKRVKASAPKSIQRAIKEQPNEWGKSARKRVEEMREQRELEQL